MCCKPTLENFRLSFAFDLSVKSISWFFLAHPTKKDQTHLGAAAGELSRWELFAEELRLAQQALNEITGEFTADDLLSEIFSRFCIGK